jgi:hypothetical protein
MNNPELMKILNAANYLLEKLGSFFFFQSLFFNYVVKEFAT